MACQYLDKKSGKCSFDPGYVCDQWVNWCGDKIVPAEEFCEQQDNDFVPETIC